MKSEEHTDIVVLIFLDLTLEASRIDEAHPVAVSVILGRHMIHKEHGRIVLMAGGSSGGTDGHRSVPDMLALHIALHAVSPVEGDRIIIAGHKVQARTLCFLQREGGPAAVPDAHCPGDDVQLRKHSVIQIHLQIQHIISQRDDEGLGIGPGIRIRLIHIDGRQIRDRIQPVHKTMGFIPKVAVNGSQIIRHLQEHPPVVSISEIRILLGKEIHGIGAVSLRLIGIARESPVLEGQKKMHIAFRLSAIILMQQITVAVNVHLIGRSLRVQCKQQIFFIDLDCHSLTPCLHSGSCPASLSHKGQCPCHSGNMSLIIV